MSDVRKIRFENGLELRIPDGMDPDEFFNRHIYMSLAEGTCPYHQVRLTTAEDSAIGDDSAFSPGTGLPWLFHHGCGFYWQINTGREMWTQETASAWQGLPPSVPAVAR